MDGDFVAGEADALVLALVVGDSTAELGSGSEGLGGKGGPESSGAGF